MQKKQHCHIAFILASFYELSPYNEPGFLDGLAPLQDFKSVAVELKKRPWEHIDRHPASFGTKEEAENDVNAVSLLKQTLGCDVEGWRETGNRVKIVRTFVDGAKKREILWDSDFGDEEAVGEPNEDVIMGEDQRTTGIKRGSQRRKMVPLK